MPKARCPLRGVWLLLGTVFIIALMIFSGATDMPARENNGPEVLVPPPVGPMLHVGEELEYGVSYAFFDLGTIRIQIVEQREHNGKPVFYTKAFIDSNPSLDWLVDLHVLFESIMDRDIYSHVFLSIDSTEKEIVTRQIQFDYGANRATIDLVKRRRGKPLERISSDTIRISSPIQDGLSLFFYARDHVLLKKKVYIPTIIDNKEVTTYINFMGKRTTSEIDAVSYPIDVLEFDGKADYVGIFGMTGGFRGWFSNDSARVPIQARMNVILGSVKIELLRWKRSGWSPPRYVGGT